jgi:2-polyprenyl-3-methyl-5-hydroxy-6-metoxy-1,4-benzoquinol methylase
MKRYQRVSLVIANEGIAGLFRRVGRKFFKSNNQDESAGTIPNASLVNEYQRSVRDFNDKALHMGYGDLRNYWWYHTVDLGNGLVTPGCYDYRQNVDAFKFPEDMTGMRVLDVGSATGFFAFEFEKRGAEVTSVEIPSIASWDRFPGETSKHTLQKFERALANQEEPLPADEAHARLFPISTPEELQHYFFDGPFEFCHKLLGSKVRRCHSTVYDLSRENLGTDGFDLIFAGDVLVHLLYPLTALAVLSQLCRGTLIVAQEFPDLSPVQSAMVYIGGDKAGEDKAAWWLPDKLCLEQMLRKLGFENVQAVGAHSGSLKPKGIWYERTVIHAAKAA